MYLWHSIFNFKSKKFHKLFLKKSQVQVVIKSPTNLHNSITYSSHDSLSFSPLIHLRHLSHPKAKSGDLTLQLFRSKIPQSVTFWACWASHDPIDVVRKSDKFRIEISKIIPWNIFFSLSVLPSAVISLYTSKKRAKKCRAKLLTRIRTKKKWNCRKSFCTQVWLVSVLMLNGFEARGTIDNWSSSPNSKRFFARHLNANNQKRRPPPRAPRHLAKEWRVNF